MTSIQTFLKEFKKEGETTRKMLQIVPDDKYDWKPHEKSMVLKRLATHVAELPTWIGMTFNTSELDFASNPYMPEDINTTAELMVYFEKSLADGLAELEKGNEEQLADIWTLRNGDKILNRSTKEEVLRMTYCQIVHHRAQLGVYLRLLNVRIPGSYGPSYDDMNP